MFALKRRTPSWFLARMVVVLIGMYASSVVADLSTSPILHSLSTALESIYSVVLVMVALWAGIHFSVFRAVAASEGGGGR